MSAIAQSDGSLAAAAPTSVGETNITSRPIRRDAVIYGAGIVMRRAATLIMLPVYTRMLTPTDYGLLQMLDIMLDVASILMSAGMASGVMRFYFKAQDSRSRNEVVVTSSILILGMNLLGGVGIALTAPLIHQNLLGGAGSLTLIYVAAANFALNETLTIPMLLMQMEGRATLYSVTSLARLVLQLSLNIGLLVFLKLGPLGILVSTLITNVAIGVSSMIWMLNRTGLRTSMAAVKDLRRFGVPYQLAAAALFTLQFGDRFFIERYSGLAVVGLYAFAYQFGFLIDQLGAQPFVRAWQPRRFAQAGQPRSDREASDNAALHALTLCVVSLGLAIVLFARPALRVIADPSYFPAVNLMPMIVIAFVFQTWGSVVQFGIDAAERTSYAMGVVWFSAALAVALYAALVPPFGAYGAGGATLISFAVRTAMLNYFAQKVWPLRYDWLSQIRILIVAGVIGALGFAIPAGGLAAELSAAVILYLAYTAYVWRFELPAAIRDKLRGDLQRVFSFGRRRVAAA